MAYVELKAEEEPRRIHRSGFGDIYDAQICTYFVRSAESRGKANKKKTQRFLGLRNKGKLNRRGKTKTRHVLRSSYENGRG